MPIRNIWSLQPGECLVAETMMEILNSEVYFPIKDVGTDLLAIRNGRPVRIQVKESRYYGKGDKAHSWHQLSLKKIKKGFERVDFYVFLTYLPEIGEHRFSRFQYVYLIVPYFELNLRLPTKDPGSRKIYRFYFHIENDSASDLRVKTGTDSDLSDYSGFFNAWHLIDSFLENE